MSKKHCLFKDFLILGACTAAGLYAANRWILSKAENLNLLGTERGDFFHSSAGDLYYSVEGIGNKPLLLLHSLRSHACSNEWNDLIKHLKYDYTIYTLDLPGCGRSAKPALTYTNYMYVQVISSFIEEVIGDESAVCTAGYTGSIGVMLAKMHPEQVSSLHLITPPSLKKLAKTPDIRSRMLQLAVNTPIIGTAIYNLYNSRRNLDFIIDESWYNPFHIPTKYVMECYEAAHKDNGNGKHLQASLDGRFVNWDIRRALPDLSIPVTLIIGDKASGELKTASEYSSFLTNAETVIISGTKLHPHLENTESVACALVKNI